MPEGGMRIGMKEQEIKTGERDWLTGVYNRQTTQDKIDQYLKDTQTGVFIVIDIESLDQMNNRYGHTIGDQILQEVARILGCMVFGQDVLGRVGGDEFVIYMSVEQDTKFVEARCKQIKGRLREIQVGEYLTIRLSVTLGGCIYEKGDSYQSLLKRAVQAMEEERAGKKRVEKERRPVTELTKGLIIDMNLIQRELSELELLPGAFCQDYATFKNIYRFVERYLRRTQRSACIILLTFTDKHGEFPTLKEREKHMDCLKDTIQSSLRSGDVFTQYSSCQFLVMVLDVTEADSEMIALRICDTFYSAIGSEGQMLLHHCYPMKPAGDPIPLPPELL